MANHKILIMDTTLRDGEQTNGVSFSRKDKLSIAKNLLVDLRVDKIEIASARVSDGELKTATAVIDWARDNGLDKKIEILGFLDGGVSIEWIKSAGGSILNLLTKGSEKHLVYQLKKTIEQHLADIKRDVLIAKSEGLDVNIYLEDWSNGMRNSKGYVLAMIDGIKDLPISRVMLPDTLGVLSPDECSLFCGELVDRYPDLHFDFHPHNDYDLATANCLAAVNAGVKGVHVTVNGLGERAGNASLSSVIPMINDFTDATTSINEKAITKVSDKVEYASGLRVAYNTPVVGDNVFTQCSGVHADGDNKHNLYFNSLMPERFGRLRRYALGKTSGKANIAKNLEELGIELSAEDLKIVTDRVVELSDKKDLLSIDDLPYIIADVTDSDAIYDNIKLVNYVATYTHNLLPTASLSLMIDGQLHRAAAYGDGQFNAFVNALKQIYKKLGREFPKLLDYNVTIPPGGRTNALVETVIKWQFDRVIITRGLDPDQISAAVKATIKMLNIIENDIK